MSEHDYADAGVVGSEATADYCYTHQAFCDPNVPDPNGIGVMPLPDMDDLHPLWMPLSAYYSAKQAPDVLDVETAAEVLAENVRRFLAALPCSDPCSQPSGYHDDGDPMCCTLPEAHGGHHAHGTDFTWAPGTYATDSVQP